MDQLLIYLHRHQYVDFHKRLLMLLLACHKSDTSAAFMGFRYSKFWSEDSLSQGKNKGFSPLELILSSALTMILLRLKVPGVTDSESFSYCPLPLGLKNAEVGADADHVAAESVGLGRAKPPPTLAEKLQKLRQWGHRRFLLMIVGTFVVRLPTPPMWLS